MRREEREKKGQQNIPCQLCGSAGFWRAEMTIAQVRAVANLRELGMDRLARARSEEGVAVGSPFDRKRVGRGSGHDLLVRARESGICDIVEPETGLDGSTKQPLPGAYQRYVSF